MPWVVDTCVLIDVGTDDPAFGTISERLLTANQSEGLVACPFTTVELAPTFAGNAHALQEFLYHLGVSQSEAWTTADTGAAFDAWWRYVSLRRARAAPKRPLVDLLIGAFATRFRGLITRNPADFRPYFRELRIVTPSSRAR
jgi:predicted nucleic acid-binding protein